MTNAFSIENGTRKYNHANHYSTSAPIYASIFVCLIRHKYANPYTCIYVCICVCNVRRTIKGCNQKCVLLDTHFLKYPNIRNWRMHIVLIPTNITHLYYFAAEQGYFIIFDRFEVIFKFSRILF